MKWTKRKPKKEGVYWIKFENLKVVFGHCFLTDRGTIDEVILSEDGINIWPITATKDWQFAGPIPEPEE